MNWRVEFDGKSTARIEIPEVPVDAVREIVVNAFAHTNYRSITEHEIDVTPTMIDIYNPGEFPINYKPEDFAERRIQSMPRNRKILDVLYRSKNVAGDVTTKTSKRVNELDLEVLGLLKENPIYTREEMAHKVGKTARTVQRALDRLKEAGKIARIGNKVSGYWEVMK